MDITDRVMRNFRPSKVFEHKQLIHCMDFSSTGEYLVTGDNEDRIVLYDCVHGKQSKMTSTQLYGIDKMIFGHTNTTILHSSSRITDSIRYLSLHKNQYIRYFFGHYGKIVTLNKSPVQDSFITGALDKTILMWDLRTPACEGCITEVGRWPLGTYDPQGLVLAIGINSETIKMFDLRRMTMPFYTIHYAVDSEYKWTDLKFSPDGQHLMISTNGPLIRTVNAFKYNPVHSFTDYKIERDNPIEASFSPDSNYIISGSCDGFIHGWNTTSGSKVSVLENYKTSPVNCIKFNPKYMMMASAYKNVEFWLPKHGFTI